MRLETTIGIALFRKSGKGIEYLLLHHGGEYWNFPKGRTETGETEMQTALREVKEETGIEKINIFDGFRYEYDYAFDDHIKNGVREKISKHAIFFLGEVLEDKIRISDEHIDYGWFDYNTAKKRMFYQRGKNLLRSVNQFILKQQDFVL